MDQSQKDKNIYLMRRLVAKRMLGIEKNEEVEEEAIVRNRDVEFDRYLDDYLTRQANKEDQYE